MENSILKSPMIVVGMGELGSVFARGFLKLGYPVQGITRNMSMQTVAESLPNPQAVLIAVGEADLHATLKACPSEWADKVILIQNELLPRDWQATHLIDPTVISVWFEKKKGMDSKQVLPSPVYGQHAQLVADALAELGLETRILQTPEQLNYELVRKNLYILTTNIAGLEVGGNVDELAKNHADVMNAVALDVLAIQDFLTAQQNSVEPLMAGLLEAFAGDPQHGCMGRSAPARLKRALMFADQAHLSVPTLRKIASLHL